VRATKVSSCFFILLPLSRVGSLASSSLQLSRVKEEEEEEDGEDLWVFVFQLPSSH
jgi:hypothetical protein